MCVSYDIENVHKYPWHALKESPWCDGGGAWLCIVREAVYIGGEFAVFKVIQFHEKLKVRIRFLKFV